MYTRLVSFFEYDVFCTPQFGFRKVKGIKNAILTFTEPILVARDNNEQRVGLFLDLSKAFDSNDILIKKLKHFGIMGLLGKWFTSYLSDRKQLAQIESVRTSIPHIKQGVPQGSILGPVLFLLSIYIYDLPLNISQAKVLLFADTNIIFNEYRKK